MNSFKCHLNYPGPLAIVKQVHRPGKGLNSTYISSVSFYLVVALKSPGKRLLGEEYTSFVLPDQPAHAEHISNLAVSEPSSSAASLLIIL